MEQYLKLFKTKEDYEAVSEKPPVSHIVEDVDVIMENSDPCDEYDYIEIGGIKWATKNVGACKITDAGLYFAWGETQGYTIDEVGVNKQFTWTDYKFSINGSSTNFSKYNGTDGKTVLDIEDDAAVVNLGSNWRMPTTAEYQALGNATTSAWTSSYEGSGVPGIVLTSRTDSSKKLFFPAAGRCVNGSLDVSHNEYLSSSLLTILNKQYEYQLSFSNSGISWTSNAYRYIGCLVRAIFNG